MNMKPTYRKLLETAADAAKSAYVPYSGFSVGAALLCADGTVFIGCNIENASFTPTVCAERVAFFKAVSGGKRDFEAIAIVGGKDKDGGFPDECVPCGVCRQVMSEFCKSDFRIITRGGEYTLDELLPKRFSL